MASATGVPEENPALQEEEPLLGRPGDVTQKPGQGLLFNLFTGTGKLHRPCRVIAQTACLALSNPMLTFHSNTGAGGDIHTDCSRLGGGV